MSRMMLAMIPLDVMIFLGGTCAAVLAALALGKLGAGPWLAMLAFVVIFFAGIGIAAADGGIRSGLSHAWALALLTGGCIGACLALAFVFELLLI